MHTIYQARETIAQACARPIVFALLDEFQSDTGISLLVTLPALHVNLKMMGQKITLQEHLEDALINQLQEAEDSHKINEKYLGLAGSLYRFE